MPATQKRWETLVYITFVKLNNNWCTIKRILNHPTLEIHRNYTKFLTFLIWVKNISLQQFEKSWNVTRENLCKSLSYEKRTRKMLMKLTPVFWSANNQNCKSKDETMDACIKEITIYHFWFEIFRMIWGLVCFVLLIFYVITLMKVNIISM